MSKKNSTAGVWGHLFVFGIAHGFTIPFLVICCKRKPWFPACSPMHQPNKKLDSNVAGRAGYPYLYMKKCAGYLCHIIPA